jgi:hypothetical protein
LLDLIVKYKKAAGVLLVAVLAVLASVITDGITAKEWTVVAGVGLASFGTSIVPNLPTGIGGYAKAITTFLIGGTAVLSVVIDGGLTTAELIEVLLAAFAAVGITVVPKNIGDYRYKQLAVARSVTGARVDGPFAGG